MFYCGRGQSLIVVINLLNSFRFDMSQAKATRCGPCNKPVKDNDSTAIGCEKCSAWFHGQCVGLSPDDVALMDKIRGCFWLCSGCLEGNIFTFQAKFELIIQRQESLIEIKKSIKETVENVDPTKTTSSNVPVNNSKLINNSSSYTILGDLNLPDICWASSDGGCDYSKLFLEVIEDHSLMPLVYEPTHRSDNTLDIILTSHTELFTAFVNEVLYSDHFPLFAFFTIPEAAPTVIGNFMKSSLSKSYFSHSIFNSNISPCFTKLIMEQNSCYSISTTNDYVDSWYAQINHAIFLSCAHKTKRRQQLPYYYSSHTVHLLNKHHSISKRTANTNHLASIQQDLNNSIEVDKTCLLESLRPNSTRDCFKYPRSFTKRKLPDQMHWMNRKASTSIEIAIILNDYFCSVFLEKHEIQILQPEKPTIFYPISMSTLKRSRKLSNLLKLLVLPTTASQPLFLTAAVN